MPSLEPTVPVNSCALRPIGKSRCQKVIVSSKNHNELTIN